MADEYRQRKRSERAAVIHLLVWRPLPATTEASNLLEGFFNKIWILYLGVRQFFGILSNGVSYKLGTPSL